MVSSALGATWLRTRCNSGQMIGFIGLGTMGRLMVENLAKGSSAGLLLNDACRDRLRRAVAEINASVAAPRASASHLPEIATQCDTVFLCLPDGDTVRLLLATSRSCQ